MAKTPKKKPDELTNEEVLKKLFPKKVVKELKKVVKEKENKNNDVPS